MQKEAASKRTLPLSYTDLLAIADAAAILLPRLFYLQEPMLLELFMRSFAKNYTNQLFIINISFRFFFTT